MILPRLFPRRYINMQFRKPLAGTITFAKYRSFPNRDCRSHHVHLHLSSKYSHIGLICCIFPSGNLTVSFTMFTSIPMHFIISAGVTTLLSFIGSPNSVINSSNHENTCAATSLTAQVKICLFGVLRRFQHCTGHITAQVKRSSI